MPPPPTHAPKPSRPMRGTTKHMIEPDVHKDPGTALIPAVQTPPQ
jgi:hypothetical protein